MFIDKEEYKNSKQKEREEIKNNPSSISKVKGALLCGMMVASITLTGCGNETQLEESTQVSQEIEQKNQKSEPYYFFNGVSDEPIIVNVVDEYRYAGKYGADEHVYVADDSTQFKFNSAGCEVIVKGNYLGAWEGYEYDTIGIYSGAAMVKIEYSKDHELAQEILDMTTKNEKEHENIEFGE